MVYGYLTNGKPYQIMELPKLDPLFGQPKYFHIAVAVFNWLIPQIHAELGYQSANVEIDVIKVVMHFPNNKYPCLGIHYKNTENWQDLEPLIEATTNRLLDERHVMELVSFIAESKVDWQEVTNRLLSD